MASPGYVLPPFVMLLLLALPILMLLLFSSKKKGNASEDPELPPCPPRLPLIGNLHQLAGKNLHRSLWELSKKHGPLMHLKLGNVPVLVVSSAAIAKEVLKTHDVDCANRPIGIATQTISYGQSDIVFPPHGQRWKELRRICMEELLGSRKVASMRSVIEEEIGRSMRWIASRVKDSPVVDVSDSSSFLLNSIICRTAFGRSHHDGGQENMRFHTLLTEAQAMMGGVFLGDYLPQFGWVDVLTGMRGRLRRSFGELDGFLQQLIQEHDFARHRDNMLDSLLHIQKDTKNLSENEIKGLLIDVFIGGTDTSMSAVEWAMTELIRHPDAMKMAQEEVRSRAGRKGKVEEGDIRQLRYLKAVIKETMRLHPATPLLIPRQTIRGFKLQGYDVAPKTTIFINPFAIGRDPASWESPQEFLPERFLDAKYSTCSTELSNHHDFKLLPFGEGRRICPGMNLGLLMTELALANLLYCFDWSMPAGMTAEEIDMGDAPGITVHRRTGLCLMARMYDAFEG